LIIIIPTSILLYQGYNAIQLQRKQLEISLFSDLERIRGQIFSDLNTQWGAFREQERVRSFYDFQPITPAPADNPIISKGRVHLRSPLQFKPHHFTEAIRAMAPEQLEGDALTSPEAGAFGRIFENCLVGFFEYDPQTEDISTPYANEAYPLSVRQDRSYFDQFLQQVVIPNLRDTTNLITNQFDARSILLHIKTRRIQKFEEPRSIIEEMMDENGMSPNTQAFLPKSDLVEISYYDYTFNNLEINDTHFVVGFRLVLMGDRILFQGFVISTFLFLQEAQSYLEQFQPDYGNILITQAPPGSQSIFEPFTNLSITFKPHEDQKLLAGYYAERNRFWFTVVFLFMALSASMIHMARLILAENELITKKKDFVSAVTHELKAPLTSIRMYAEMLEEGWARGKEKLYYHYIHSETNRLTRLVQNILDFARIERGEFNLIKKNVNFAELVEETVESWRFWMEENGMNLIFHAEAKPLIKADPDSLKQVIYNLCDNAIKYGKGVEDPTLTFSLHENEKEAILVIYDNGPGIPKEDEPKIFQRFFRCGNELTREQTGTGLGLALVKEIIEQNGGRVRLHPTLKLEGFALEFTFDRV
ncbi:MAG: HAMP domain-containing histidine kinase, partial [Acidobacteria bacterium]|nr:HAMP domain-containing histidine kinase [Acidobacteriota bacterium]